MTPRVLRSLALGAVGALSLVAAACGDRRPLRPEIRLSAGDFIMRISTDPMPPHARERQRWRVVVTDKETNQPIQNGEGRIFATSHDNRSIWDGLVKGEEVGTYYGNLSFLTSGEWAMAVQFRGDSARPLERVDWLQEVRPERPLGAEISTPTSTPTPPPPAAPAADSATPPPGRP